MAGALNGRAMGRPGGPGYTVTGGGWFAGCRSARGGDGCDDRWGANGCPCVGTGRLRVRRELIVQRVRDFPGAMADAGGLEAGRRVSCRQQRPLAREPLSDLQGNAALLITRMPGRSDFTPCTFALVCLAIRLPSDGSGSPGFPPKKRYESLA